MAPKRQPVLITGLRGRTGRASTDPLGVPPYLAAEFLNCDRDEGSLAHKRNGTSTPVTGAAVFTGVIAGLARYVPGAAETAAQLFGVDANAIAARIAAGTAWAAVTLADAIATRPQDISFAALNGKLFMAYDSTVDRLHLMESDGTHRRTGLATPAAPTVANTGAGAYAATARTYKVAYTVQVSSVTVRRSELSAAVSFTPSGAGTAARVTKPATIGESETHWELYGAATTGDTTYKLLATTAVGTTTYDDSTAPASYSGAAPPTTGANTVQKSYKYILSDGSRLLGSGGWETTGYNSRVEFTPVLNSTSASEVGADDERVPNETNQKNYLDVDENDGDFITGLGGPLFGSPYVFKKYSVHKLIPTGNDLQPYKRVPLKGIPGTIRHQTIVMGEDAAGQPSMAWWSHAGPYRLGANGYEYIGTDVEDIHDTINLAASTVTAHGVWHADKHQFWWWVATGSNNEPDTLLVFDPREARFDTDEGVVRGGWFKYTGEIAKARCSVMFSNTVGATMSRDLKPYIGQHAAINTLWKCDNASVTNDAGTNFQAYVETVARAGGLDELSSVYEPRLIADAASGVTITVTAITDFGEKDDVTGTALLTASAGSETVVRKKVEGLQQAGVEFIAWRVGDSAAADNNWTLHGLITRRNAEDAP